MNSKSTAASITPEDFHLAGAWIPATTFAL